MPMSMPCGQIMAKPNLPRNHGKPFTVVSSFPSFEGEIAEAVPSFQQK